MPGCRHDWPTYMHLLTHPGWSPLSVPGCRCMCRLSLNLLLYFMKPTFWKVGSTLTLEAPVSRDHGTEERAPIHVNANKKHWCYFKYIYSLAYKEPCPACKHPQLCKLSKKKEQHFCLLRRHLGFYEFCKASRCWIYDLSKYCQYAKVGPLEMDSPQRICTTLLRVALHLEAGPIRCVGGLKSSLVIGQKAQISPNPYA
jgi:hypothetical protein